MYHIDFQKPIHVHFIGIGGISMSGFAELLHTMGFKVSGSDRSESKITKHLETLGISVIYEQTASNITSDIELVVYTAAVHEDNEEFAAAKAAGINLEEMLKTHGTSEGLWKLGCGVSAVASVSALDLGVILIME